MAYEFKLPDIGEGVHEGEIVQWLVKQGDFVKEDQAIVEVMTDKVTAEIPAPMSGVLTELRGKPGEVITVGSVIAVFDENAKEASASEEASSEDDEPAPAAKEQPAGPKKNEQSPEKEQTVEEEESATAANGTGKSTATATQERPLAGKAIAAPATRKLARELGVALSEVAGSGPRGRVTPDDVKTFQGAGSVVAKTAVSAVSASPEGFRSMGEHRAPFGGLRRKIAEHLVKSKQTAPHFAYVEEVDMSKLVAMRADLLPVAEAEGVKLSYLPFVIKAVIAGLRKYPVLNSQLDEQAKEVVYKNDFHMGVAVATDQGLIVPVVKYADQKNSFTLAAEIKTLAEKARAGKLTLEELKGGTFTLTSIGSIGGLFGIPIINYPEVAIMGINKIERRPVVRTIEGVEQIVIREMMHLSISCDHRVVDGAEAALFVKEVIQYLENPARLMTAF
ncbi:dihydrolipoamide acetyltransferase family protein [Vampirovibrio sp.]|uniref:dihydrolipoamide acetyltransferase family protein n=1 Tax=Vampirovibrio sp. TaxID=2717857 RepID=UPI00359373AB